MRVLFVLLSTFLVWFDEAEAKRVAADTRHRPDLFTRILRDGLKSSGLDPLGLPGFSAEFNQHELVRLGPQLHLQHGNLSGLSNVRKTQDIILMLGLRFKGDLRFEFMDITATYLGKLILSREDHDLEITVDISEIKAYIFIVEESIGNLSIKNFKLTIKGFSLTIDCHKSAHLKLAAAFNKLNVVLKNRIESQVNSVLKRVIENHITKLLEP